MHAFQTFAALALIVATSSAFQSTPSNRTPLPSSTLLPRLARHHSVLHQSSTPQDAEQQQDDTFANMSGFPHKNKQQDEEEEMVEFSVSAVQITLLRKEANKRESRKKLPKVFLPVEDTNGELSQETFDAISTLFETDEIIEVRGISRDKIKKVFDIGNGIAATLEDAMEKPVVFVDIKGFAVKLYCPWDDDQNTNNGGKRIPMRTSYQPGQWTRKPKALRDNRGQVILDEDGKSIKEIPEY